MSVGEDAGTFCHLNWTKQRYTASVIEFLESLRSLSTNGAEAEGATFKSNNEFTKEIHKFRTH